MKRMARILVAAVLALCFTFTAAWAADSSDSNFTTSESTTYLAFSSDAHNEATSSASTYGDSANRLNTWLKNVSSKLGATFSNMGFCGDSGSAYQSGDSFWNNVQEVMDIVSDSSKVSGDGFFVAGNHECQNGSYSSSSSNSTAKKIKSNGTYTENSNYVLYSLGATSSSQSIANVSALETYLKSAPSDRPIFILSHFPLHSISGRTTSNAADVVEVLNKYASTKNIVFLWGHNHTSANYSEKHYDKIYKPGSLTETLSSVSYTFNFTYAAAGCMSDSEYSSGSAAVDGKGLAVKIASEGTETSMTFQYYDENGNTVGDKVTVSSEDETPETPTGDVYTKVSTPVAGEKYVIVADGVALTTTFQEGYTNSSNFSYDGLKGESVTVTSAGLLKSSVTSDLIWTAGGSSSALTFTNDGKKLSATYVKNSGSSSSYTGTLTAGSTSDTWSWVEADGMMKLKSTNASDNDRDNREMYLAWDDTESDPGLFTVRSESYSNPPQVSFYKIEESTPVATKYTVAVNSAANGSVSVSSTSVEAGETVTVTATPVSGYELDSIIVTKANGDKVSVTSSNAFTMPASDVTVSATFSASTPGTTKYAISIGDVANGSVSVNKTQAAAGDTVTITASANDGYKLGAITVTKANGGKVTVASNKTFTMPASNVTVSATFNATAQSGAIQISGSGRYDTAAQIALEAYPNGSDGVIVASGENPADALSASALAGLLDYPILLTPSKSLNASTAKGIDALGADHVIIVGGTAAVSAKVESSLREYGKVERVYGQNRYETANEIYEYGEKAEGWESDFCIVATGEGFADALSIASYAYASKTPILLSSYKNGLTDDTEEIISEAGFSTYIVGGTLVVSTSVEKRLGSYGDVVRLAGENRYETSLTIAEYFIGNGSVTANGACIATGKSFPDALAGSVLAGKNNSVILLADKGNLVTFDVLSDNKSSIDHIYFLGGDNAVTPYVQTRAKKAAGIS